jgi:Family of unknown function (DUF6502)
MSSRNIVRNAHHLPVSELLLELARALLPHGMTPKFFGELSRYAFARIAAEDARFRNGRVSYSRVAARTGLTRADAKRLLTQHLPELTEPYMTPMHKVIFGWRTDERFVHPRGYPKRLKIKDRRHSFAHLVREHGGDVPYRAVLEELIRTGAVEERDGEVLLKSPKPTISFEFLTPAVPKIRRCLKSQRRVAATHR